MKCIACHHMNQDEIDRIFKDFVNIKDTNNFDIRSVLFESYVEYIQIKNDFDEFGDFQFIDTKELGKVFVCPKCGVIRKVI